jgi:hypothetical protein
VQAAVGELADALERELVERGQLPHAREVEERVAGRLGEDAPEHEAEEDPTSEDGEPGDVQLGT